MIKRKKHIVVIGAGIVGTAMARELSKYDFDISVIEKELDVCLGVSRASSSIIHPGFRYWKPGTLRARAVKEGIVELEKLSQEIDFPFLTVGVLIVAWDDEGIERIKKFQKQGEINGLTDLKIIGAQELKELEPNVTDDAKSALYSSTLAVSSSFDCAIALAESAAMNGVNFFYDESVKDIKRKNDTYVIYTDKRELTADFVINAAGLYVDIIASKVGSSLPIQLERGQEYVFDKNVRSIINHAVFPAKGPFIVPTVHGNIICGTTKDEPLNFHDTIITSEAWEKIYSGAKRLIPELPKNSVIRGFAGIRSQPKTGDISIIKDKPKFISVSTGSPGIQTSVIVAKWIISEIGKQDIKLTKKTNFVSRRTKIPQFSSLNDSEREKLISQNPSYGHVICRCETVTEAEIIEAIRRGARSVDGVKYRTRAGMGRCQGGFCGPRIARILSEQLGIPMEKVLKNVSGSLYAGKKTKDLILE